MRKIMIHSDQILVGAEHTSKGNQDKWRQGGYWYKADQFGYEGIAESVTSYLLTEAVKKATITPLANITKYEPVMIHANNQQLTGCACKDFAREGWSLIPLERLYRVQCGDSAAKALAQLVDAKARIQHIVDMVRRLTGLEDFGAYLTLMLEMDAFFLNEDRHTNNIAVLWNSKEKIYDYAPYYDMGLSLFADTRGVYPLDMDFEACRKKIHSKPFDRDFDTQLDAAQELYGYYLHFPWSVGEMRRKVEEFFTEHSEVDSQIAKRVAETVAQQTRKYGYMFN